MRPTLALAAFVTVAAAPAAQAADWQVSRAAGACETQVALGLRGAALPLVIRDDGARPSLTLTTPPGVRLLGLEVDGFPAPLAGARGGP
ncbi:MAG: hypothetical protein ABW042_08525, partial [Phenylobacterium sp.]